MKSFLCLSVFVSALLLGAAGDWQLKNIRGNGAVFSGGKAVQKIANGEFELVSKKSFPVKGGVDYIFDFQCRIERINGAYVNFYLLGVDARGKVRPVCALSGTPGSRGLNRDRMSRLEVPSGHFLSHRLRFKASKGLVKVIPVYESSDGEVVLVPGKMEISEKLKRPDVVDRVVFSGKTASAGAVVWRTIKLMPEVEYALECDRDIPDGKYELHFISGEEKVIGKVPVTGRVSRFKLPGETVETVLVCLAPEKSFSAAIRKDFKLDFQRGVWENEWQGTELNRGKAEGKRVYFRRTFKLDQIPVHAAIRFFGHNRAELFVNGSFCGQGSQFSPECVNITKYLKPGENVIGIVCHHDSGVLRVLFDLYMKTAGGKDIFIVSDAATKCSPKPPRKGWQTAGYDDSGWFPAAEGGSPKDFGDAIIATRVNNRHERLFIGAPVELGKVQFSLPGTGVIGKQLKISSSISKYPSGKVVFRNGDNVYETSLNPDGCFYPRYLPAGKYQVFLRFDRAVVNGSAETSLGTITLAPAKIRVPEFEVRKVNGKTRLTRDGKIIPSSIYCHGQDMSIEVKRINDRSGIKLHMIWIEEPRRNKDGSFDFSVAEAEVRNLINQLEHDPEAFIFVCYSCRPSPRFARRKRSRNDLTVTSKGERLLISRAPGEHKYGKAYKTFPEKISPKAFPSVSHASETKISEYRDAISSLVRYFENSPYASKIVGYGVSGEMDGQWHLYAPYSGAGSSIGMVDYSPVMLDFFRKHLKNKYGSDSALQKAWSDVKVTLDTAVIPGYEERVGKKFFVTQAVADYNEAFALAEANIIQAVTSAARSALKRKALIWVYTKDSYRDVGLNQFLPHVLNSGSGFEQYTSSSFDAFGNPTDYYFRQNGLHPANRGCSASAHLNNKIKLLEMDLRTYLTQAHQPTWGGDTAYASTHHFRNVLMEGFQYGSTYRFYSFWLGWYNNDGILNTMRRLNDIERAQLTLPERWKKRVCHFYDDRAITHIGNFDPRANRLRHYYFAKAVTGIGANTLNRSGVGFETYYLRDLLNPEFPVDQFDVFVFDSCFRFDAKLLAAVNSKLRNKGKVLIFPWGSGFLNARHEVDAASVEELTGVRVSPAAVSAKNGAIKVNSGAHKLLGAMKNGSFISARHRYNITSDLPMFKIDDPAAVIGGYFGDGKAALAVKKVGDSYSVVVLGPDFSGDLLRSVCKAKNIHIYSDNGYDFVATDGNFLSIHSAAGGRKRVPLPEKVKQAVDFFSGKVVARNTNVLDVVIRDDETLVLRLEY